MGMVVVKNDSLNLVVGQDESVPVVVFPLSLLLIGWIGEVIRWQLAKRQSSTSWLLCFRVLFHFSLSIMAVTVIVCHQPICFPLHGFYCLHVLITVKVRDRKLTPYEARGIVVFYKHYWCDGSTLCHLRSWLLGTFPQHPPIDVVWGQCVVSFWWEHGFLKLAGLKCSGQSDSLHISYKCMPKIILDRVPAVPLGNGCTGWEEMVLFQYWVLRCVRPDRKLWIQMSIPILRNVPIRATSHVGHFQRLLPATLHRCGSVFYAHDEVLDCCYQLGLGAVQRTSQDGCGWCALPPYN